MAADDGRASCHPSRRAASLRSAALLRMRSESLIRLVSWNRSTRLRTAMSKPLQTISTFLAGLAMLSGTTASAQSEDRGILQLEAKIQLGDVRGRIDHMA